MASLNLDDARWLEETLYRFEEQCFVREALDMPDLPLDLSVDFSGVEWGYSLIVRLQEAFRDHAQRQIDRLDALYEESGACPDTQ